MAFDPNKDYQAAINKLIAGGAKPNSPELTQLVGERAAKVASDPDAYGKYAGTDPLQAAASTLAASKKSTPAAPTFKGASSNSFASSVSDVKRAGVNTSVENQIANIRNNLDREMAAYADQESQVAPAYQDRIKTIAANKFATTERQKEVMNAGGWDIANSGLAVGEVGRIGIAAEKDMDMAARDKALTLEELARRRQEAIDAAEGGITSVRNIGEAAMSGVDAEAMLAADERDRAMYGIDVNKYFQEQGLGLNKAQMYGYDENGNPTFAANEAVANRKIQEAGLTGDYNGVRTLAGQGFDFNKAIQESSITGEYEGKPTFDMQKFTKSIEQYDATMAENIRQFNEKMGLENKQFAWSKDSSNPDNIYKVAMAHAAGTKATGTTASQTKATIINTQADLINNLYKPDANSNANQVYVIRDRLYYNKDKILQNLMSGGMNGDAALNYYNDIVKANASDVDVAEGRNPYGKNAKTDAMSAYLNSLN